MKTKKYFVLFVLILLGAAAALGILIPRIAGEESNKTYDIVMDYSSLKEMTDKSDESMEFWLQHFSSLGVDKLGITEETIQSLSAGPTGTVFIQEIDAIRSSYGWEKLYPVEVHDIIRSSEKKGEVLVSCTDPMLFSWIVEALSRRCDRSFETLESDSGDCFLYLTGEGRDVAGTAYLSLPLGIAPDKQALAQKYGYTIIPRTIPVEHLNGITFAEDVLESYKELGVPYLIGGGSGIPGADDKAQAIPLLLSYLDMTGTTLGVVETSDQKLNLMWDGLDKLVEASGENAVRVFSMWDYVQWRYGWYGYEGSEEIVNCLYRAAYERNCRIIYLKMMLEQNEDKSTEYITDPEAYTALLTDFTDRMEQRGYALETVSAVNTLNVSFLLTILTAFGAVAAAVLILGLFCPLSGKQLYLMTAICCVAAAGVLYVMPNTGRLILSIGGGIAMPLLAAIVLSFVMDSALARLSVVPAALLAVSGTALICLVGGFFAAAPLSDTSYMLEMELYRGVKVMQLVPIAGFVCYFLKSMLWQLCRDRWTRAKGHRRETAIAVLESSVKVKYAVFAIAAILAAAVIAAVGSYYLARTGHSTTVSTADLEMTLRNLLECYLPARPRTKEFLIGYPCVMLYVWCRKRQLNWLSVIPGVGAVIGLTSVVNTFLHIRTTFTLSLIRVGTGIIFGVAVGLVIIAVAEFIYRFIKKRIAHV